jgi:hypothetical protein
MGRVCSKHGEEGKCISSSCEKPEMKRRLWRSLPLSEDDTEMSHKEKRVIVSARFMWGVRTGPCSGFLWTQWLTLCSCAKFLKGLNH